MFAKVSAIYSTVHFIVVQWHLFRFKDGSARLISRFFRFQIGLNGFLKRCFRCLHDLVHLLVVIA